MLSTPPETDTSQNYRCFPPDDKNPVSEARLEIISLPGPAHINYAEGVAAGTSEAKEE
jgi:hypothetical protein